MWVDRRYIQLLESERGRLAEELAAARVEIGRLNRALIFASPSDAARQYQSFLAGENLPKASVESHPHIDWNKPWPEVQRQWAEQEEIAAVPQANGVPQ